MKTRSTELGQIGLCLYWIQKKKSGQKIIAGHPYNRTIQRQIQKNDNKLK